VLDVPGVSAESLDLAIEDGRIAIDAHREKEPTDDYQYVEENRSLFLDIDLPLPDDASDANATATVDRGVLELTLRNAARAARRRSTSSTRTPNTG